jgi:tRNA (Thr-GGU) A37 N-methylase
MFPRRYGTPRQGALAKGTLGVIDIDSKVIDGASALDGLDKFSFAWLVFIFHENTNEHKYSNGKDNFKVR